MKILIFSTAYLPLIGGAEIAIDEITKRLPEHQFDLICAKINSDLPDREKIGAVTVYRLGWGSGWDKKFLPFLGFLKAVELHRRSPYELLWAVMASYSSLAALFFKWFYPRVPLILTLQEGDAKEHIYRQMGSLKPLFKQVFKKTGQIQTISRYLAQWAGEMGATAPVTVVPNGVDLDNFKPKPAQVAQEARHRLDIAPGERLVVSASRLEPKNGLADLIQAVSRLEKQVKLLILGRGSLEKHLKKLAIDLGIAERVLFLGEVAHKDLPLYLAASEVFCRPSLSEGLGNSFLEAMAAGVPVVGTRVGGIPDFLEDGVTGLFCEVGNPASIASSINRLLNDEPLRVQLIANGQKLVKEKYSWDNIVKQMEILFQGSSRANAVKRGDPDGIASLRSR